MIKLPHPSKECRRSSRNLVFCRSYTDTYAWRLSTAPSLVSIPFKTSTLPCAVTRHSVSRLRFGTVFSTSNSLCVCHHTSQVLDFDINGPRHVVKLHGHEYHSSSNRIQCNFGLLTSVTFPLRPSSQRLVTQIHQLLSETTFGYTSPVSTVAFFTHFPSHHVCLRICAFNSFVTFRLALMFTLHFSKRILPKSGIFLLPRV